MVGIAIVFACFVCAGCVESRPFPLAKPAPNPVMSWGMGDCAGRHPSGIHCYKVPPDLAAAR